MVLRIEDLDPRTKDRRYSDALMRDLEWLGLDWDEGPYYQSDREDLYADAIRELDERGLVYPCFCTRSELHAATAPHASDGTFVYQGTCRNLTREQVAEKSRTRRPAARLRVPEADDPRSRMTIDDRVFGRYTENLALDCGDFIVRRSDGVVAYQLAVVVDDGLMGVNEVVRGRDLLPSSARQAYLADLLGYPRPSYAHVPLLMDPDGRRLSKRDRDLDVGAMRDRGLSPARVIGCLASLIGLAEEGEEIGADELAHRFDWDAVRRHRDDVTVCDSFLY